MSTVLVGVDGSERSVDAIALARDLAGDAAGRILLAAAVRYPAIALVGEAAVEAAGIPAEAEREAEQMLAGKLALLADVEAEVRGITRLFVSPPQLLQSLAEEEQADLVVVGSTHVGRAGRAFPGSTGERLLHGAPCPVAIAPTGYRDREDGSPQRIGVAYDGSDESRAALQAALMAALRFGAELQVIAVLDVMGFGAPALMGGPGYDRTRSDLEAGARERLDAVVAELPPTVHPTGRLLAGDPAEQLAEQSGALDLLFTGSRRYGPLRAVLLGGVTGRLMQHAACPVIVTPRGVDRPLAGLLSSPPTAPHTRRSP
jgi:nucleotide-binding universal stress UspA family protein